MGWGNFYLNKKNEFKAREDKCVFLFPEGGGREVVAIDAFSISPIFPLRS